MSRRARVATLLGLVGVAVFTAVVTPAIPQDPAYHRMADARTFLGVPNALNVVSNLAFVLAGPSDCARSPGRDRAAASGFSTRGNGGPTRSFSLGSS